MNLNVGFSGVDFCVQMILAASLMSSSGMQDEIIVQHVEGRALEPSCFGLEGFEVLECDVSFVREEAFEELLDLNPAVVCVHAVVKDELANALYDTLKDRYAHFYHLIPESSLYSQNALFVASQYSLSDLRCLHNACRFIRTPRCCLRTDETRQTIPASVSLPCFLF